MPAHAEKSDANVLPITSKPSASVVFVTPDMAKRWLKQNTKNRKIRQADVNSYARDMAAGDWQLTGEAIKFAADGSLLDGQHRLAAIVKTGVTIPLYVVRGISPEAQRVMDTGRKRTASDALAIKGESHTTIIAACARLGLGVEAGLTDPGRHEATHSEIEEWINTHQSARYAAEFAARVARRTDCPPAVVAYTFMRMAEVDTFDAAQFWMAASEKVGLRAGDPVIALTNRLAESRRNRERLTKAMYLSLIFRAWNARRAGKSASVLRVNSSAGGIVPIPEPK